VCAFVFVKREGRNKQSRPDASIQPFKLSHNHAHRDPRLHLPICPHAFLRYATFPTCILALYLQTVRGTRCNTARSSILIRIFADLRRTRRDTCAAHLQTCEGTWRNTVRTSIHITLYLQTCEGLGVTRAQLHTHYIIFADLRRDLCN
jgi:hypothetical protein